MYGSIERIELSGWQRGMRVVLRVAKRGCNAELR